MPPSLEGFVRSISDAGLMDAEEVRAFIKNLPESLRPASAEELAKALVRSGRLTKFQAQLVYQAKAKGLVIGNYVIEDKLGEGGMGQVFRARHRRMDRLVALKVLPATATKSADSVKRFHREVRAAARLTHPNIVAAHDADEEHGVYFLAMEYVEGDDLSQIVKRRGALPIELALDYMIQAAQGLQYAHEQGVIHRDIKPSNMLVDRRGTVKILDMGLARLVNAATVTEDGLTRAGQVMGTIDYIAPEQAIDTKHADQRSDIYSLGCTLYYLLTGSVVFPDEPTIVKKILAHTRRAAPSLHAGRAEIPDALETLYRRMLAKDPAERPQTMGEVVVALQSCRIPAVPSRVDAPAPAGTDSNAPDDSRRTDLSESSSGDTANLNRMDVVTSAEKTPSSILPALTREPEALPWSKAFATPRYLRPFARLNLRQLIGLSIVAGLVFTALLAIIVSSLWPGANTATAKPDETKAVVQAQPDTGVSPPGVPSAAESPPAQNNNTEMAGSLEDASDQERTIGAMLLGLGGKLAIIADGAEREITSLDQFPKTRFVIYRVDLHDKPAVTDDIVKDISALKSVQHLALNGTSITDAATDSIARMPSLLYLSVAATQVSDPGIARLARSKSLTTLSLEASRITDASMSTLAGMPRLVGLGLAWTQVSDEGLRALSTSGLNHISLLGVKITDAGLAHLGKLKKLSSFDVDQPGLSDQAIRQLIDDVRPFSTELGGTSVSDDTLAVIGCNSLVQTLGLQNTKITDQGLRHLEGLLSPKTIRLAGTNVTAEGVRRLGEWFPGCEITVSPSLAAAVPPRGQRLVLASTGNHDASADSAYSGFAPRRWVSILPSRTSLNGWMLGAGDIRNVAGKWECSSSSPNGDFMLASDLGKRARDVIWRVRVKGAEWTGLSLNLREVSLGVGRWRTCFLNFSRPGCVVLGQGSNEGLTTLGTAPLPSSFRSDDFEVAFGAVGRRLVAFINGTAVLHVDDSDYLEAGGLVIHCNGTMTLESIDCQLLDYVSTPAIQQILDAPTDTQRETAEWILRLGGTLAVIENGAENAVPTAKSLPASPFSILRVSMTGAGDLMTDVAVSKLARLPDLQSLDLSGLSIGDAGLEPLKTTKTLKELRLTGTKVTSSAMAQLRTVLTECRIIADEDVANTGESVSLGGAPKQAP